MIGGTRYNTNGSLDSSYGTNGTIIPLINSDKRAFQPDGKLVIGEDEYVNTIGFIYHYFLFTRYNLDGTIDNSFYGGQLKVLESFRNFQSPDRSGYLVSLVISNSNELAYIVRYEGAGGSTYSYFATMEIFNFVFTVRSTLSMEQFLTS